MTDKKRKFWGWGSVGEGFSDADMRPYEAEYAGIFGVDGFTVDPFPRSEEIDLAAPRLAVPKSLEAVLSADHWERLVHTFGRAFHEQVRIMARDFRNAPDLVAFPRHEQDVIDVLDWCTRVKAAAIPFGGGSSVVGGVHPDVGEGYAGAVSIDLRRMNKVLEVDHTSRAARIQAGTYGPELEDQLRPHKLTFRHYPQSFQYSTLGGWLATRSGGHFATLYTHIDDLVESMRVVTPAGVHDSFRLPGSGAGPSPDRMFLGSEGALGIITEAWVRLQDRPTFRANRTVEFKDYFAGARAVRAISQAGLYPANIRLLNHDEVKYSGTASGEAAILVLGFEGADHPLEPWMARALECCSDHGGVVSAEGDEGAGDPRAGAAGRWRNAFIMGGYLREAMVARGLITETFETAITWDKFEAFYPAMIETVANATRAATGRAGIVSCRFTHVYPDGPAPYFTFRGLGTRGRLSEQYDIIKNAAADLLIDWRATITHHHAVGRDHRPWYDRQRSPVFAKALTAAKRALDPAGILNPGVLLDPAR
ncbi:MAG: FAD-binding oxidoreductase [Alphaproteobacteria bacterium]|nr:FAD-binding oxidoreductase [Alphaproteobacteria bacterium]